MTDHYETSQHLKTLSKLYLVVAFALLIMLLAWIYIYLFSVNEAFDIVMWIGLISALFSIGLLLTVILTERRILRRVEGVARELVRQSNELEGFRFAVDNTFDQILITDPAGVVIYANNATTKITGYSKREILGHRPGDLWGGHMPHRFYEKMWSRIKKDKKFFVGTIVNRKKGGKEYTAEMSITPILGKRSQILYYILVARDVTREIAADKLKAEFITLVSHQLKTPVASMKWMLEMLIHNELGILDSKQRKYIKSIYEDNIKMISLVNELLKVSRIEAGSFHVEWASVSLNMLLAKQIRDSSKVAKSKSITIKVKNSFTHLPIVLTDHSALESILSNILSNAITYSPQKSVIHFNANKRGKDIIISVEDRGIGILKKYKPNMFTKFFRTDEARLKEPSGSGLGLYITKKLADLIGCKVWFESDGKTGTTFYVSIPIRKGV